MGIDKKVFLEIVIQQKKIVLIQWQPAHKITGQIYLSVNSSTNYLIISYKFVS